MSIRDLVLQRRTIRKFQQKPIANSLLEQMVNSARLAPSSANMQPLEYIIVNRDDLLEPVFSTTKWAGYINPRGTPKNGEKPVAYVIVLINRQIKSKGGQHDCGAAIMSMILMALEQGVGSCWIGSIKRKKLRKILNIPNHFEIDSILALGYPAEKPIAVPYIDSVQYWQDENQVLHVPKRDLKQILHWNCF